MDHYRDATEIVAPKLPLDAESIFFCGMAEYSLVGEVLKPFLTKPSQVISESALPRFAKGKSLVILLGDHDETQSLYQEARRKGAQIFAFSSGKIRDLCVKDHVASLRIPKVEGDAIMPTILLPLLRALQQAKYVEADPLDTKALLTLLESPKLKERAIQLAEEVVDTTPFFFAGPQLEGVAKYWALRCNRIGIHAFAQGLPQARYANVLGFHHYKGAYYVVFLQDEQDPLSIKKSLLETKTFITKQGVGVTELAISGKHSLVRLITALYLGDVMIAALEGHYGRKPNQEN